MFQLYSKRCEYALRALVALPPDASETAFTAKELCRRAGIPESFTRKVFQALVRARFLKAVPGVGGGYRLVKNPRSIPILKVIELVDGKGSYDQCVMGLEECGCTDPCSMHEVWMEAKKKLISKLTNMKVADLIGTLRGHKRR